MSKYITDIKPITGTAYEPLMSDNSSEPLDWRGFKFIIHCDEEENPDISRLNGETYVYRVFAIGSDDIVHISLSSYDSGNNYELLEFLSKRDLIVILGRTEVPVTFMEKLAVYLSSVVHMYI